MCPPCVYIIGSKHSLLRENVCDMFGYGIFDNRRAIIMPLLGLNWIDDLKEKREYSYKQFCPLARQAVWIKFEIELHWGKHKLFLFDLFDRYGPLYFYIREATFIGTLNPITLHSVVLILRKAISRRRISHWKLDCTFSVCRYVSDKSIWAQKLEIEDYPLESWSIS